MLLHEIEFIQFDNSKRQTRTKVHLDLYINVYILFMMALFLREWG